MMIHICILGIVTSRVVVDRMRYSTTTTTITTTILPLLLLRLVDDYKIDRDRKNKSIKKE